MLVLGLGVLRYSTHQIFPTFSYHQCLYELRYHFGMFVVGGGIKVSNLTFVFKLVIIPQSISSVCVQRTPAKKGNEKELSLNTELFSSFGNNARSIFGNQFACNVLRAVD